MHFSGRSRSGKRCPMSEPTNPKTNHMPLTTMLQGFFTWLPRFFTWPVTVFLFMLLFWSPLHRLFQALPDALANSETVTLGSLSLRVGKRLSDRENQDVRDALSGMDAADLALVAQTPLVGNGVSYGGISFDLVNEWAKFEQLGMVTRKADAELTQEAEGSHQPKSIYGVKATAKYFKVRKFLLDTLADVVRGGVRDAQPVSSGS
jgi:hypothetical protein